MKLYYSKTSPFARKVRIVATQLDLDKQMELVTTDVFAKDSQYKKINPLIKVPALLTESGEMLVNSPFICQYLASKASGQMIFPQGPELWTALNFQAIADGGTDAAVLRRLEMLRPPDKVDSQFIKRQNEKIENALDFCDKNLAQLSKQHLGIAEISVICFVDYINFRLGHENWKNLFPRLFQWTQEWNEKHKPLKESLP